MEQPPDDITTPIAATVSDVLQVPMERLPPLSESVDLDGLEAIVSDDPSHDVTVTFFYAGLRVLVHSGRTVYVDRGHERGPGPVCGPRVDGR